jgi:arylsulfatase A-like enzyme
MDRTKPPALQQIYPGGSAVKIRLKGLFAVAMSCFVGSCTVGTSAPPAADANASKPNVVLIIVDDLGFMDVKANNPESFYDTPSIDKFAANGALFNNSYASNPVCSPSRLALLTGMNPASLNATDWFRHKGSKVRAGRMRPANNINRMPLALTTIAEAAPDDYRSVFIGKWHLGEAEAYWPENQGFDINIAGWSAGSPRGGYFAPFINPRLNASAPTTSSEPAEYLTDRLTNEAIDQLNMADGNPFLMVLSYYSVHVPLQAPQNLVDQYTAKQVSYEQHEEFSKEIQVWPKAKKTRIVRAKQNHPVYAAMVETVDANIGRFLDELNKLGLDDNTVVIITSDNGGLSTSEGRPTSNLPFRGGKGWLFDGGIRVPLMIRSPDILGGTVIDTPVIATDVAAGIFSLLGQVPADIEGQSIFPLTGRRLQATQRPLFWHYPHYSNQGGFPAAAVRVADYKLIENLENGEVMLFNLRKDKGELNNLASKEQGKTGELQGLLRQWMDENHAQTLRPFKVSK